MKMKMKMNNPQETKLIYLGSSETTRYTPYMVHILDSLDI